MFPRAGNRAGRKAHHADSGSLEIQPERYSVKLGGQSIACTPREVELPLICLPAIRGACTNREQILAGGI
ncbi:MAG: hypothetical protein V8Q79_10135 [Christensenellales bacterium]